LRPFSLAEYIARSAFFNKVSISSPSSGYTPIPIEGLVITTVPEISIDFAIRLIILFAQTPTSSAVLIFSRIIVNSSPPNLATVSESLAHLRRRFPTFFSNLSPNECPIESLIVLKLSKSINNSANRVSFRLEAASACDNLSINNERLGNLVRESKLAN